MGPGDLLLACTCWFAAVTSVLEPNARAPPPAASAPWAVHWPPEVLAQSLAKASRSALHLEVRESKHGARDQAMHANWSADARSCARRRRPRADQLACTHSTCT